METELEQVRKRGYALNREELFEGIVGVAVPITDNGRAFAALAVHGPMTRLSIGDCEKLVPKLKRAADKIARAWLD